MGWDGVIARVRRSLILKITVPAVLAVLVLSFLSTLLLGSLMTRAHERAGERRAARFAEALTDAFRQDMENRHPYLERHLQLSCRAGDRSAFFTDRAGNVRFACDERLLGTVVDPRATGAPRVRRAGQEWVRRVQPLEAGPSCNRCHGPVGTVGYLMVDEPVKEAVAEVWEQERMSFVAGGLLAAVLSLVLVLVHLILVHRPVKQLQASVERMRAGDLSARVAAADPDEIGLLAGSLNDMAASLERAKGELGRTHRAELAQSEKLAALGQLFSSVAHEIKNQLAGIIGALKVLEGDVPRDDANKPVLGKILTQMQRMSQTAVSALEFARPLKPGVAAVDVAELLDRTIFFVEREAALSGVTLRRRYAAELSRASVDEELMKQVFLNLLLNGVQAMPTGGTLEVATRPAGAHALEVTISDQGVGISPEHRDRIFSPFFSTKERGTGLGLYIARQIVETQQGEIRVESTPGQGTSFTVRLPADQGTEDTRYHGEG